MNRPMNNFQSQDLLPVAGDLPTPDALHQVLPIFVATLIDKLLP
jgi:hypothetical protein